MTGSDPFYFRTFSKNNKYYSMLLSWMTRLWNSCVDDVTILSYPGHVLARDSVVCQLFYDPPSWKLQGENSTYCSPYSFAIKCVLMFT